MDSSWLNHEEATECNQSSESFGHWHIKSTACQGQVLINLLEVSCHKCYAWLHDVNTAIATHYRMMMVTKFRNISGDDAHAIMKHLHGPISFLAFRPEKWCIIVVNREASQKSAPRLPWTACFLWCWAKSLCELHCKVINSLRKLNLLAMKTNYNGRASQSSGPLHSLRQYKCLKQE